MVSLLEVFSPLYQPATKTLYMFLNEPIQITFQDRIKFVYWNSCPSVFIPSPRLYV